MRQSHEKVEAERKAEGLKLVVRVLLLKGKRFRGAHGLANGILWDLQLALVGKDLHHALLGSMERQTHHPATEKASLDGGEDEAEHRSAKMCIPNTSCCWSSRERGGGI